MSNLEFIFLEEHLTIATCAMTMGSPIEDMTIPAVRNIHSSTHALLAVSRLSLNLRDITVGTGDNT